MDEWRNLPVTSSIVRAANVQSTISWSGSISRVGRPVNVSSGCAPSACRLQRRPHGCHCFDLNCKSLPHTLHVLAPTSIIAFYRPFRAKTPHISSAFDRDWLLSSARSPFIIALAFFLLDGVRWLDQVHERWLLCLLLVIKLEQLAAALALYLNHWKQSFWTDCYWRREGTLSFTDTVYFIKFYH